MGKLRDFQTLGRSAAYGANGMAATSAPPATLAAIDVLRRGGNAIDAAMTASAVLCVVEPHMTGIGGDCFALIGTPDGTVTGSTAPAAGHGGMRLAKSSGLTEIARRACEFGAVPGAVDAFTASKGYGTMTLGEALDLPAMAERRASHPAVPRTGWGEGRTCRRRGWGKNLLKNGRAPLWATSCAIRHLIDLAPNPARPRCLLRARC